MSPTSLLAGTTCILGLLGAGLGGYLTWFKFRMIATPCQDRGPGCRFNDFLDCTGVLADPWSIILDLPLSLWASAFYCLVLVLGLFLWARPRAFGGRLAALLLALGLSAVLASLLLAIYSARQIGALCPFSSALYGVSLLLFILAIALQRCLPPAEGTHRLRAWLDAFFLCSTVFISAAGSQAIVYQRELHHADPEEGCPLPAPPLPDTPLVFGALAPDLVLALFLDPTCTLCKTTYRQVLEYARAGVLGDTQVRVYMFPRAACDPLAFPDGFLGSTRKARDDNACLAASAVFCAEQLGRGAGVELLLQLYRLSDLPDGRPTFTRDKIDVALDLAKLSTNAAFTTCLDEAPPLAAITVHQKYLIHEIWSGDTTRLTLPELILLPLQHGSPDRLFPANEGLLQQIQALRQGDPHAHH